jgi:hypothetical protein
MRAYGPMSMPVGERLHVAAAVILAGAVLVATLLLGGGGVWVRLGLEVAVVAAVALWASGGCQRPRLVAMALGLAALPLLQVIDLPQGLLLRIAPMSAAAWKVAEAAGAGPRSCISVEPATTLLACRRALLVALGLAALIDVVRIPLARNLLTGSLALTGGLVLVLGMAFGSAGDERKLMRVVPLRGPIWDHVNPVYPPVQSSGFGMLEWVDVGDHRYRLDSPTVGAGFGPFLYSNHFPCALVLMLPFATAVIAAFAARRAPAWATAGLAATPWIVGLLLTAVGIRARAATVVVVFTVTASAWLRAVHPRARLVAGAGTALGAAGLVLLALLLASGIDFSPLAGRLPAAFQPAAKSLLQDTRSTTAAVAGRTFRAAPFAGTGADSYRVMYTKMKPANEAVYYAHNEPFQWLAENGFIGGLVMAAAIAAIGRLLWLFRGRRSGSTDPMHVAAWTATLGVSAAALFEWVWHLPALCLASCIAAALAAGWPSGIQAAGEAKGGLAGRALGGMAAVACLLVLGVLARDALAESSRQELQRAVVLDIRRLRRLTTEGPGTAIARAIDAAGAMAAWDPGNARLAALLSQAHLHASRLAGSEIERADLLATSARWAARARQASPLLVGLPEPRPGSAAAEAAARTP